MSRFYRALFKAQYFANDLWQQVSIWKLIAAAIFGAVLGFVLGMCMEDGNWF